MKKISIIKTLSQGVALILAICLISGVCTTNAFARTADTVTVTPNNVSPSDGMVYIGVEGEFATDYDAAIKRINEIRYEACEKGYKNPETGKKLTLQDYTPIKWSRDLEEIARIRAAENSVLVGHDRPNGGFGNYDIKSSNGIEAGAELIAGASTLVGAINSWYSEVYYYLQDENSPYCGHYFTLIAPSENYIGIAAFSSSACSWGGAAGMFSTKDGFDETPLYAGKNVMQLVEVDPNKIGDEDILYSGLKEEANETYRLQPKKSAKLDLVMESEYEKPFSDMQSYLFDIGDITWKSSNPKIATVDAYGLVNAKGLGDTVITATSTSGRTASIHIVVGSTIEPTYINYIWRDSHNMTIYWYQHSKSNGYVVEISKNKNFKKLVKRVVITNKKTTKLKVGNLKANTKYYVRIKTRKKADGKWIYSTWDEVWATTKK